MGKVIFSAWRVSHLPFDQFPPLADYDTTTNLMKRARKVSYHFHLVLTAHLVLQQYLDCFAGAPKQHLFIGLMRLFCAYSAGIKSLVDLSRHAVWEYCTMALMLTLRAISQFLAPIGINRLLTYIENGGKDAMVKPWVWILFLFASPFLSTTIFQWYIFVTVSS